jgi:murein DD-endopeptidase MepM/ murein hydrolase activator NlpD
MPVFPLAAYPSSDYTAGSRRFGSSRSDGRKHGGCDLLAPTGTAIYAVDDGTVLQGPYSFYSGTDALEVTHTSFVVRYGEIQNALVKAGDPVTKGQLIAEVGGLRMLHFELYRGNVTGPLTQRSEKPYQRRSDLLDPTTYLQSWPLRSAG